MTIHLPEKNMEDAKLIVNCAESDYQVEVNKKEPVSKTKRRIFHILDSLIASILIGPLIISFWRGTWELIIVYKDYFPPLPSTLFSMAIHLCLALTREILQEMWEKTQKKYPVFDHIIRRLYMYFFSVISIMQWTGLWNLSDELINAKYTESENTMISGNICLLSVLTIISFFLMVLSKTLINILDAPYIICLDIENEVYDFPTRFQIKVSYFIIINMKKST